MSKLPIAVELFAGCGGISTGLLDAGIRVVAGFDHNRSAIEAFNYNHSYRGSRGLVADLSNTSGEKIIALTADVTLVDVEKCKTVGMNDYISKPIDEKLLYSKILECLKRP